jgi:acyl-coenzyme A thioesterase PaaI-like protein
VEYKMNFFAPGRGDAAVARAQVVHAGRTLTVCQVEVFAQSEGNETLCALMQQTLIRLANWPDDRIR